MGSRKWIKSNISTIIVVIFTITVGLVYAWIAYLRYITFNADVWDLGIASQLLFTTLHGQFTPTVQNPQPISVNRLIYFFLVPIYYFFPSPSTLLILQSIWLTLGAIPIYMISRKLSIRDSYSAVFAISYLLYFPLGGVYWFDFHYMALFPTFFLFGVYFYFSGRIYASAILMVFAMITDFLIPVIMFFFGLFAMYHEKKVNNKPPLRNYYSITIMISSITLFLLVNFIYGFGYTLHWANNPSTSSAYLSTISYSLPSKFAYFGILFAPLLFLSFFAPAFLVTILPYFIFAMVHNYVPYFTPLYYQYPALTAPIIFISAILGFRRLNTKFSKTASKNLIKTIITLVLIVNIVLGVTLSPLGNEITGQGFPYHSQNKTTVSKDDIVLKSMVSLIPKGSSVLIQGNMPQLINGYKWYLPYMINNTTLPSFAIDDPYNYFFNNSVPILPPVVSNEVSVFNSLSNSGNYGIYAEEYGIVILKKYYNSTPIVYKPLVHVFSKVTQIPNINGTNQTSPAFMYSTKGTFMVPGEYIITISSDNATINTTNAMIVVNSSSQSGVHEYNVLKASAMKYSGNDSFNVVLHDNYINCKIVLESTKMINSKDSISIEVTQQSAYPM